MDSTIGNPNRRGSMYSFLEVSEGLLPSLHSSPSRNFQLLTKLKQFSDSSNHSPFSGLCLEISEANASHYDGLVAYLWAMDVANIHAARLQLRNSFRWRKAITSASDLPDAFNRLKNVLIGLDQAQFLLWMPTTV